MSPEAKPELPPTLASLRRKGAQRRSPEPQPSLFASLFELTETSLEPAAALPEPAAAVEQPVSSQVDAVVLRTGQRVPSIEQEAPMDGLIKQQMATRPALQPEPQAASRTWTVSGLVRHVRGLVEQGYGQITVEGEISNWRPAGSGHCYFTVKDTGAQLSAVLFRRQASLLRFRPSDGDAVRLHGQLSVFESRGQMQLIVEWMEQVGFGALLAAVQRLKEALRREGLFDRKRSLPPFPRCIGVVTSLQGAALRDIIKVCRRRHAAVRLLIYPAAVQGPNCPADVAAGVRWFSTHPDHAEVVLVARGGGSWEDLHGFDDEGVVRAIAACTLPVITGIGHATDATIADAAADRCAPTPSAAAELLTAAQHRVEEQIERLHGRLLRATSFELLRAQGRLAKLNAGSVLRRVQDGLNRRAQRTDELGFRGESAARTRLRRSETRLGTLSGRLARQNPALQLTDARRRFEALQNRLRQSSQRQSSGQKARVDRCLTRLEALNPLRVLERGYALVYDAQGHLLRDADSVRGGDEIRARLGKGNVRARVLPQNEPAISQP